MVTTPPRMSPTVKVLPVLVIVPAGLVYTNSTVYGGVPPLIAPLGTLIVACCAVPLAVQANCCVTICVLLIVTGLGSATVTV